MKNEKTELNAVQFFTSKISKTEENTYCLPRLSVIWLLSSDEKKNMKTYQAVKEQTIASLVKYIVYDSSNSSNCIMDFCNSFHTVLVPLKEPWKKYQIYNDARQYCEKTGFVLVVESGDTFEKNYFESILQGMKRTNTSIQGDDFYLVGMTSKKAENQKKYDVFSSEMVQPELQHIDFSTQYETVPYFMAGTIIDAKYFSEHSFVENLKYEYEKEYLLRLILASGCMRYMKTPLYVFGNPSETDLRLFPGAYEKEWYYQAIDQFWIPFVKEIQEHQGFVPKIIQYMAYHALCVRTEANLDNKNKHCIEEKDAYEYICGWSRLLQFIDDEIIMNIYMERYVTENVHMKRFFLRVKYLDETLQMDTYSLNRELYVGRNHVVERPETSLYIDIQLMEYKEGRLYIDALLSGIFDLEQGNIIAKVGEKEYPIVYNERYAHTKLFGITIYKRKSFEINIPIEDVESQNLMFFYVNGVDSYRITLTFQSHWSKLTDKFKNSYWYIDSNQACYMVTSDKMSILIQKCGKKNQKRREHMLRREMFEMRTNKARKLLLVRMAYFFFKRFIKKRPIWLFLDKIYKGGDSAEYIYKYAAEQKDNVDKYYLIDKNVPDYKRLKSEGYKPLVRGSIKHRLIFLYSDLIVMSNSTVCEFNDYSVDSSSYVRDLINFHGVCVQHGMSVQKIAVAQHRLRDNLRLYFCASKYEMENLNHPIYDYKGRDILKLTGVPRYDGLVNEDKRQIVIAPTWRMQAALAPKGNEGVERDYNPLFKESDYYKIYNSLINDSYLIAAAKENKYRILYVLHPIVSPQLKDFEKNEYVDIVASTGDMSYEKVFRESSLMVTDFSGVQFDFAYMRKPVVYLHHEEMPAHYEEGIYHYDTMAFGEICKNNKELIEVLVDYMKHDCKMKDEYVRRADEFFAYDDRENCKRIYSELISYSEKNINFIN